MLAVVAALSLLLLGPAHALNDWSVPCTDGTCSWDLDNSANHGKGTATGTLQIAGAADSISDITEGAGWKILDCDPNASEMNIRLVCLDGSTSCDHVYKDGAQDTIIRLPSNCGRMPFARVAREWDSEDQTIPSGVLVRRSGNGSPPTVKAMALDTDFSAIDASKRSQVNFNIVASTDQGAITGTIQPPNRRSRLTHKRGLNRRGLSRDFFNPSAFARFDKNKTANLPIQFSKTFNVFNTSIQCPPVQASVNIDIGAKVNAQVNLNVVASGSVIPPKLDKFGVVTAIDGDLVGSLNVVADVQGTFESPTIPLFEVGIPGLDFPGILSIGPTFDITAVAKVTLDTNIEFATDLAFNMQGTKIAFPASGDSPVQGIQPSTSNLKLSSTPSVKSTGTAEVHIVPQVNLGITALKTVNAKVFANLDGSAFVQLSLEASRTITAGADPASQNATFGGCAEVGTGISANVGADGSFFGLFDNSATKELFAQSFTLFKKCFGDSPKRDMHAVSFGPRNSLAKRGDFACLPSGNSTASSIVDGALTAVANSTKSQ